MKKLTEEIKQALEAATPGPWEAASFGGVWKVNNVCIIDFNTDKRDNAHLIANAPTWLSQLLQEREQLVEALKRISDLTPVTREDAREAIQIADSILEQVGELE